LETGLGALGIIIKGLPSNNQSQISFLNKKPGNNGIMVNNWNKPFLQTFSLSKKEEVN